MKLRRNVTKKKSERKDERARLFCFKIKKNESKNNEKLIKHLINMILTIIKIKPRAIDFI